MYQVRAPTVGYIQADIADLDKYYDKEYNPYRYGLAVIDVYSRYGWFIPLQTKTSAEVASALTAVAKDMNSYGYVPLTITTDNGGEFKGGVKELVDKYGVKSYVDDPYNHTRTGMVERFIRTIKQLITKAAHSSDGHPYWSHYIEFLLNQDPGGYNYVKHIGVGTYPANILKNKRQSVAKPRPNPPLKYEVGEYVRVLDTQRKAGFSKKGDEPYWSKEIHYVTEIEGNKIYLNEMKQPVTQFKLQEAVKPETFANKNTKLLADTKERNLVAKRLRKEQLDTAAQQYKDKQNTTPIDAPRQTRAQSKKQKR